MTEMNWIKCSDQLPYAGQYFAGKDHEGNLTIGIFTGAFTSFQDLPPHGNILEWVPIFFSESGVFFEDGSPLTNKLVYEMDQR